MSQIDKSEDNNGSGGLAGQSADISAKNKKGNDVAISVFFPCYNEQENVLNTVTKATVALEKIRADYEIIIVNDGSKDATGEIADKIAAQNKRIRVVHHQTNLGYGSAVRSGIKAGTKNYIFLTDGDGQFDINEMPPLLPLMDNYDIVCGFRINRQDNFARKLNGFLWTKLVCLLFGLSVRDVDCAFKLFNRKVFNDMPLVSTGALISAEILARAARKGFTITQKGVHHYPRTAGKQTGANFSVILRAFKELFKLYNTIRRS